MKVYRNMLSNKEFKDLKNQSPVKNIYSYQESGIPLTYKRDIKLKEFFKNNNIVTFLGEIS